MVDTLVLGTNGESRVGSSPAWGTLNGVVEQLVGSPVCKTGPSGL